MTCIIAVRNSTGQVYIGGDKAASGDQTKSISAIPKVFKKGKFYIGYTTSFLMGQLLQFNWNIPRRIEGWTDDMYIFITIRDSIIELFNKNKFGSETPGSAPSYGEFIFVYKNRIFLFQPDSSIIESKNIEACGSGATVAIGAAKALMTYTNKDASDIITKAIGIASNYIVSVSEDCDILECIQ